MPQTAGGTRVSAYGATTPAAWSCGMEGHGVRARRFRARRKRERVSATPIERHQKVAEAMSRGAEPAVDACRLSPVWNTVFLCGNGLPPMPELRHTSRTAPST
ncbi:MAG TPA: hypothetical protein H9991_00050 [Candidatus Mailhella excrementigallinarum]|nr:hypothetical protein [Candidatus Mailhella excrementigallinarum]